MQSKHNQNEAVLKRCKVSDADLVLKSDSHFPKKKFIFLIESPPSKNDEKCFLFHFKKLLRGIKVRVFLRKSIQKKHLCHHDKNYCYYYKSNIPVINLILGSRNMIRLSKNMSL